MFKNLIDRLLSRNTLYYPGCLTKFVLKDIEQNYKTILTNLGVNFIILPDMESCCGSPALNAGYTNDFKNLVENNMKIFWEHNISKIITNCPGCYNIFSKEYTLKIEHITETILKNLHKLKLNDFNEERITYYDPCNLGRHSGIYYEPREILKKLNFNIVELKNNKSNSMCCGAGAGLKTNAPRLSNKIAKYLLSQVKTKKLITPCPMCYAHLKENSKNIEVVELSQVIV
jgi:Fe-S oxidoreductase